MGLNQVKVVNRDRQEMLGLAVIPDGGDAVHQALSGIMKAAMAKAGSQIVDPGGASSSQALAAHTRPKLITYTDDQIITKTAILKESDNKFKQHAELTFNNECRLCDVLVS